MCSTCCENNPCFICEIGLEQKEEWCMTNMINTEVPFEVRGGIVYLLMKLEPCVQEQDSYG